MRGGGRVSGADDRRRIRKNPMIEQAPRWSDVVATGRSVRDALGRRVATIAMFAIGAALLALAYLFVVPATYEASTELLLDPRRLQVVQNDLTPRSETNDLAISMIESQLRVMQSETVLRDVVDHLRLETDSEFVGPKSIDLILRRILPAGADEDPKLKALRALQRIVSVERANRSYVAVIKARSEDANKAALIADTVAAVYLKGEVKARTDAAQRVSGTMADRLKELATRVRESESRVEDFKKENDLIAVGGQSVTDQQLEELNTRLVTARARTAERRAELEQINRVLKAGGNLDAIPEAMQSPVIAALRTQYADLLREEGRVLGVLGARHPQARVIHDQLENNRRLVTEELKRIAAASRSDFERTRSAEDGLTAEFNLLKSTAFRTNESMVRMRELERLAQSNRAVYEAFLVRAKEVEEQSSVDTSNTRVIAVAIPPNRPTMPRGSLVVVALLAGLMVGFAVVVIRTPHAPVAA